MDAVGGCVEVTESAIRVFANVTEPNADLQYVRAAAQEMSGIIISMEANKITMKDTFEDLVSYR